MIFCFTRKIAPPKAFLVFAFVRQQLVLGVFRNIDNALLFIPLVFPALLHDAKSTLSHTMKRHHLLSPASEASAAAAASE